MSDIQAILFDADGVVQRTPPAFRQALIDCCAPAGVDVDAFLASVFAAERPSMMGEGSFREHLAPVLRGYGLQHALEDVLRAWHIVEPDRAALACVESLRARGYLCCLATNQQDVRKQYMSLRLGYALAFDRQFYSCDIGCRKPDDLYFNHILDELALEPSQVLFVDDAEINTMAAARLGMPTLLYAGGDLRGQIERLL